MASISLISPGAMADHHCAMIAYLIHEGEIYVITTSVLRKLDSTTIDIHPFTDKVVVCSRDELVAVKVLRET